MACELTKNITREHCAYEVAGVKEVYLINHSIATGELVTADGTIAAFPDSLKAYKVDFMKDTASFTDELAEGGNGAKYRTHTLNFVIGTEGYEAINSESKALSLGKFVAVVVSRNGKAQMLGRNNGLSATSFNYESGAADADAQGWTVVMAGTEIEAAPLLDKAAIDAVRVSSESGTTIVP